MVEHGCKIIHIDEPVLMRKPQEAMDYGIDDLKACLKGITFHRYTKKKFISIPQIIRIQYISITYDLSGFDAIRFNQG